MGKTNETQSAGNTLWVIPSKQEDRECILNADRDAKVQLRLQHKLYIDRDWEINTIANTTLEMILKLLYAQMKSDGVASQKTFDGVDSEAGYINFFDMLEIKVTNKMNSKAEKEGNINIAFYPGVQTQEIVEDSTPKDQKTWEYIHHTEKFNYGIPALDNAMAKVDAMSRQILSKNRKLILRSPGSTLAITFVMLENIYRQLISKMILEEKRSSSINYNDLIEFHIQLLEDNTVDIRLRPGMCAKLIIKSDETTEADDED